MMDRNGDGVRDSQNENMGGTNLMQSATMNAENIGSSSLLAHTELDMPGGVDDKDCLPNIITTHSEPV
jgi:hypothetical protein